MRYITFIVLFLLVSVGYSSGNVHIYQNDKMIKANIFVIIKCVKRVAYIINKFGKTRVVSGKSISQANYRAIFSRLKKQPRANGKVFYPALVISCDSQQYET